MYVYLNLKLCFYYWILKFLTAFALVNNALMNTVVQKAFLCIGLFSYIKLPELELWSSKTCTGMKVYD